MASPPLPKPMVLQLHTLFVLLLALAPLARGNFYEEMEITWGGERANILDNGDLLTLSLDNTSGSGLESYSDFLFTTITLQLKLVPNNSAGTVTTYYLSSTGDKHDEIDFEFLGNVSGQPYVIHTNVYSQGNGSREMRFFPWFDPTSDFHNYTISWGVNRILFFVDGIPIREFKNMEWDGVPFPTYQPMKLYCSLWNADDWATRGGLVKTDWSKAPFRASLRGLIIDSNPYSPASLQVADGLDYAKAGQMGWVQSNYMIYNYCDDIKRFPNGLPRECTIP